MPTYIVSLCHVSLVYLACLRACIGCCIEYFSFSGCIACLCLACSYYLLPTYLVFYRPTNCESPMPTYRQCLFILAVSTLSLPVWLQLNAYCAWYVAIDHLIGLPSPPMVSFSYVCLPYSPMPTYVVIAGYL